jgi:predicted transcriptional regulator
MAEQGTTNEVDRDLVARIVRSYVGHHRVGIAELAGLISTVHRALSGLGKSTPTPEALVPAVSIRRSVQRDSVVCLDCGYSARMLRRHIRTAHGLEPAAYRARWKLSASHPLTAPSYAEQRSAVAKRLGLGRKRASEVAAPPPKRRSRKSPETVASASAALPGTVAGTNLDPAFAASLSTPKRRGRPPRSAATA